VRYRPDWYQVSTSDVISVENPELYQLIVKTLKDAVIKRLSSDAPLGCLLSGGLDSSLVAAIAARELAAQGKRLRTFTIGSKDSPDLHHARQVAEFIGSDHVEVPFDPEVALKTIDAVLLATESPDITTTRASVGQYLISQHIAKHTDVKVILNGDGADECQMGYLYYYLAPNAEEAQEDSLRLVSEIHHFDGLRVDRCVSVHGLEARVPFLDAQFVSLFARVDPVLKQPKKERMEKFLIRRAFEYIYEKEPILPYEVLWRKKEAFSDGVSNQKESWYEVAKRHYSAKVTETEYESIKAQYPKWKVPTREAAYYLHRIATQFHGFVHLVPHYWLPSWVDTHEPSARTLAVYSESSSNNNSQ